MDTEYEIKILDIDVSAVTKALENLGFTAQPKIYFRRYIYNLSNNNS